MLIVDYGEPSIHNISSILSEFNITSCIIGPTNPLPYGSFMGLILSGGPGHVYENDSPKLPFWIDQINIPILCICYGMQLMVKRFGGNILPLVIGEEGPTKIKLIKPDKLLGDINHEMVWMNHTDIAINVPPEELTVTSLTQHHLVSSVTDGKQWWGVQFHPEVDVEDSTYGRAIFSNFINICTTK